MTYFFTSKLAAQEALCTGVPSVPQRCARCLAWPHKTMDFQPTFRTETERHNLDGIALILLMEEIRLTSWYRKIPLFTGFYTSRVVQEFFHQQYFCSMLFPTRIFGHLRIPPDKCTGWGWPWGYENSHKWMSHVFNACKHVWLFSVSSFIITLGTNSPVEKELVLVILPIITKVSGT